MAHRRSPAYPPALAVTALVLGGAAVLAAFLATVLAPGPAIAATDGVEDLVVEVVASRPHDRKAFTQGLVWDHGTLLESTGLYGQSSLRRLNAATGAVEKQVDLPGMYFGEGLALVPGEGGTLVQLTWQEGEALLWRADRFERRGSFTYEGEGWGLCYDGARLVMSDGSGTLLFRDAATFAEIGRVEVTLRGRRVTRLNELECADGWVYANVFGSEVILRIDPVSGTVTATVDASGLLTPADADGTDVLNGIAYDPEDGVFYVTGKLWPKLFVAHFVPRRGA